MRGIISSIPPLLQWNMYSERLCVYICVERTATHLLRRTLALPHTAKHCQVLPIALPHTAARTACIARTPPGLLPNTATHRPTHYRAHCHTLLHTAALLDCRTAQPHNAARIAIRRMPYICRMPCAVYRTYAIRRIAVCGMPYVLCRCCCRAVCVRYAACGMWYATYITVSVRMMIQIYCGGRCR
jgi:hypothetical protein